MNLAQLDLNLLVALDALLREQNVTRAGQRIGLSQPAMSSSLSRLRHLFGDELLLRVGQRYYLTPLALELIGPVHEILELVEQTLAHRPDFDPVTDERAFRIATSDYAALMVLDRLLPKLAREAPNITIRTIPNNRETMNQLTAGEIDIAFIPEMVREDLPKRVLFYDRWVCAVSGDNPEVAERLTREQFMTLPHLSFRPGELDTAYADRALSALGITRPVRIIVSSSLLLPFLLESTPYVILTYERLARRLVDVADIRLLEPPFDLPPMPLAMYWPPQNSSDPAHRWLRDKITETCSDFD
jgi:DNA-binding transcriptional LysR family regulator